jgi:protein TonB
MFDDFRPSNSNREERARRGGSTAVALLLYGSCGGLVIGGTTAASSKVVETLTQVQFAPAPEPPPPPKPIEVAQPVTNARPKAKRRDLKPPDKIPDQKPKESNEPLSDAKEEPGPVDGFLNGVEGGTGTAAYKAPAPKPVAPPLKPDPLVLPVAISTPGPPYSASARRKEIEGVVVVTFEVLENGTVANVRFVSGPEEFRENVLKTVATWRFNPARRGGKPVRSQQTKSIRFRLTDA